MFASKLMEKYGEGHSELHGISVALDRAHGSMWGKKTLLGIITETLVSLNLYR